MSQSILDTLMGAVDAKTIASLAKELEESPASIAAGLQCGAAAILAALSKKAAEAGFVGEILPLLTSAGGEQGAKLLALLFGHDQSAAQIAVSHAAGVSAGSAQRLVEAAAALLLGVLGTKVSAGESLAVLLGDHAHGHAAPVVEAAAPAGSKVLIPLVLGALLVAGLLWFLNRERGGAHAVAHEMAKPAIVNPAWAALGEFFSRRLPSGAELNAPKLGVENKLVDFIEDANRIVDKTTWFDFDRLLFATGLATLRPESEEQLKNVASVLKAFPDVELKIGGYTDNTGDATANVKLSAARANVVMAELVKLGVEPARLTAEGYGAEHPVAENTTEEGRAKNRRISMRVTKK